MAKRISVVISQSPSKNPAKRKLEEDILMGLMLESGIDVTVVPNLYDIKPDSTSMLALSSIKGNMVVISWMFERASHWILDRNNIVGHVGKVLLEYAGDEEDEDVEETADEKERVIESREIPDRKIYCLDLRISNKAADYIEEVKRIQKENSVKLVGLGNIIGATSTAPANGNGANGNSTNGHAAEQEVSGKGEVNRIEETGGRRWYPVIDYSRCTNCMECIDFCLFGVYGVDRIDTILVEQPDNCRKGCPACSRVCPENAIMFPQHKTPAIAGSADASASMKIDLSQLFGAPASGKSAAEVAAIERDEQLIMAGRDAVGAPAPKRQENRADSPKDDLDGLIDELDDFDL